MPGSLTMRLRGPQNLQRRNRPPPSLHFTALDKSSKLDAMCNLKVSARPQHWPKSELAPDAPCRALNTLTEYIDKGALAIWRATSQTTCAYHWDKVISSKSDEARIMGKFALLLLVHTSTDLSEIAGNESGGKRSDLAPLESRWLKDNLLPEPMSYSIIYKWKSGSSFYPKTVAAVIQFLTKH